MSACYLSPDEIAQRRTELGQVEAQLKALTRRKSVLRAEILSGFATPVKGAAPEQLPLVETTTPATTAPEAPSHAPEATKPAAAARTALQLRKAVLELLRAAKGRRSARVLATLLGETEEDVADELEGLELAREVIGKETSGKAGRAYELRSRWEAKRGKGRDVKPGKAAKKAAPPAPAEPIVLGDMTMTEVRDVLLTYINTWTRWHSGAAADHALWKKLRESGHVDNDEETDKVDQVGHEALTALVTEGKIQADGRPGDWNNGYAPLGVPRTAAGGPEEPKPPRAKKAPAKSAKPAAKKAAKRVASKGKKAPEAPKPTRTIGETKPKILDGISIEQWQEGIHSVAGLINESGATRGAWLLLHARPSATVAAEVVDLFERAGAIVPGETIQLAAAIEASRQERPGARLSLLITERVSKWVIDLVASSPKPPSADALAKRTGLHRGLFCALLNALEDEGCLRRSKGGGVPVWVVPAVTHTAPGEEAAE